MTDILAWIADHRAELLEAAGAVYLLASIYVALTPSPDDDRVLRGVVERLSFLQPRDRPGVLSLPGAKPHGRDGSAS